MQNELFTPQANELLNNAPSWLPGDDYYTNFHNGDPFLKVPEGYARLSGAGYAALHPELKDVNPEDYPSIHKMAILADVAPYSREYKTFDSLRVLLHIPSDLTGSKLGVFILADTKNARAGAISQAMNSVPSSFPALTTLRESVWIGLFILPAPKLWRGRDKPRA